MNKNYRHFKKTKTYKKQKITKITKNENRKYKFKIIKKIVYIFKNTTK